MINFDSKTGFGKYILIRHAQKWPFWVFYYFHSARLNFESKGPGTKNEICVSLVYSGNGNKISFPFALYTRETQISFFVPAKVNKLGLIFGSNLSLVEYFCLAVIWVERFKVEPTFGPKFVPFGSVFGPALNWVKRLKVDWTIFKTREPGSKLGRKTDST